MHIELYVTNIPESFLRFAEQVKDGAPVPLHSLYVVGSVLTPNFDPGISDINSVIVIQEKELSFLDFLISLGREYREQRIAPPLVMTIDYIKSSLDVFPIEFFNFREIHHTLHGKDIFFDLNIKDHHLRLQCEREIKAKLLWLGQIYIESLGDEQLLSDKLAASITGYLPLLLAILHLAGRKIPLDNEQVFLGIQEELGLKTDIFFTLSQMKAEKRRCSDKDEICSCFSLCYQVTEQIARYVDRLPV